MEYCNRYELGVNSLDEKFPRVHIASIDDAVGFIRKFYGDDMLLYESCFILLLDQSNTTIGYAKIGQGGTASVTVDVKLIIRYALSVMASGVIVAHNHPSGNLMPSKSDKVLGQKIHNAMKLFDMVQVDNLIITSDNHRSLGDFKDLIKFQ